MRPRLTLLGLLVFASAAWASEVRLTNGQVERDVTILNRNETNLELKVSYGNILVPLNKVEAIDGVKVVHPKPAAIILSPPVAPEPDPVDETLPPHYVHRWSMDIWLLSFLLAGSVWIAMLLWVGNDVKGTPTEIRRTNADVLLLPGLGFGLYLIQRARRPRRAGDSRTLDGRVAGLRLDEVPKKRSLFGGRAKVSSPHTGAAVGVDLQFLDANHRPITIRQDSPEMTGIEAARDVLGQALVQRASDVHLEPTDQGSRVRFRIDGVMHERFLFDRADGMHVASALKALAQIDVAERRKAQDGRFRVRTKTGEVDFRVATASAIHGEKLVLRILDRQSGVLGLSDLGMAKPMLDQFDRVIHSRNGMILVTGPTGSGKTSTLYAALSRLDAQRLNIMTIEDPVEYELTGATQIAVNAKAGVTYESGLRSILRQDPDVIFIGEMRDAEAAKIAARAALTGHLMFSSVHAQDAVGTVMRLEDMGIERHQIASSLLMVVAQRLVRVLCKRCREAMLATGTELSEIGLILPVGKTIYKASGCDNCDMTGYQGRTGIFELLVLSEPMRKAIHDGIDQQKLRELAGPQGYRPYREDGVEKILSGMTTVDEVIQAS
jgi:general secretion pathway protein E